MIFSWNWVRSNRSMRLKTCIRIISKSQRYFYCRLSFLYALPYQNAKLSSRVLQYQCSEAFLRAMALKSTRLQHGNKESKALKDMVDVKYTKVYPLNCAYSPIVSILSFIDGFIWTVLVIGSHNAKVLQFSKPSKTIGMNFGVFC